MGEPNLDELLSPKTKRAIHMSETAKKERAKRQTLALAMAMTALRRLHKADYDDLYEQAKAKVDTERGPLPD